MEQSVLQYEFADAFFAELARHASSVVISPGSRSTPLVLSAVGYPSASPRMKPIVVLDERSAGFVALGLAKVSRQPVALICTSGTATANYLPAVVEAFHSRLPLVVITADRPASYHDWGSPQTIFQNGIYARHVRWATEIAVPSHNPKGAGRLTALRATENACGPPGGPVHINWPLEKPLEPPNELQPSEEVAASGRFASLGSSQQLQNSRDVISQKFLPPACPKGLIVVGHGNMSDSEATAVARFAEATGWPIAAEASSGMRFGSWSTNVLACSHFLFSNPSALLKPDVAIRVGGHHIDRALPRFLSSDLPQERIVVAPPGCWDDPGFLATQFIHGDIAAIFNQAAESIPDGTPDPSWMARWQEADAAAAKALDEVLGMASASNPVKLTEAKAVLILCESLGSKSQEILYTSSSLPVRHLEYFAKPNNRPLRVLSNRGANGIDGVISSACGAASQNATPTTVLLGDLALLHDIGGLLTAAHLGVSLRLVVLNNNGGAIFSQLPIAEAVDNSTFTKFFRTPHNFDLSFVGHLPGVRHIRASTPDELRSALNNRENSDVQESGIGASVGAGIAEANITVIEVKTDPSEHLAEMNRCYEAVEASLLSH